MTPRVGVLVFVVLASACGSSTGLASIQETFGTQRATVKGTVLTRSNQPVESAIVVVRVPSGTPGGGYTMPDATTDRDGLFALTLTRSPATRGESGGALPDTAEVYVVASGGPELPDGRLPTDSVRVTVTFAPINAPPPKPAIASVQIPVP